MDPPVRDVPVTHARTDGRTRSGPGRSEERPGAAPATGVRRPAPAGALAVRTVMGAAREAGAP
ncbi:hypothetical protein, partial [[Kitasatospora] papulosa]